VYGSAGNRQRSFDDIVADMKYSYELGSRFIDLEGGEPTLWKQDGRTINDLIDAALEIGFFSITVTTNAQQDFSWIHPQSIWVSMDGIGEYHDRIRGEGTFARLEKYISTSGFKHICVNMVVNALNYESLDAAMEYAKNSPYIEQISINFHTPYPGTEYLKLPKEKEIELIDKVLDYKRRGYPIMNSRSGLKLMKRNMLGKVKLGNECFVTNFIYTDGSRGLCLGYGTEQCRACGFCMAGEMASVFSFKPDTILSGFKLRM
jgi:MoaA/NifB/PqqE/SkfB family radical SAM enzyme